MKARAVSLLSGGLDSTTLLALVISQGYEVHPISFNYGQRHAREIKSMKLVCSHYSLVPKIVDIDLRGVAESALTSTTEIPERKMEEISGDIPVTYVPSRNIIFLSVAASYAESLGINTVFIGANAVDYSGYPDCRPEFFSAMEEALSRGTKIGLESGFNLKVPLQHKSKSEIVALAHELDAPVQLTWSCYNGLERACGRCDSCQLRLKGFAEAGFPDPIDYDYYPPFYSSAFHK